MEKELVNGRVPGEMTEARKEARMAPRAANLIGPATSNGSKGKGKGKGKATTAESKGIGVNCPCKWTNSIDERTNRSHRGRVSLKEKRHKNLRVARRRRRMVPAQEKPAFHCLAEDDGGEQASEGLNHLVSRNAGGDQWSWKKVTVVVDSRAAENVMPRSMFP